MGIISTSVGSQPAWDQTPSVSFPLSPEADPFFFGLRLIKDSVHHLQTLQQSGADQYEAWNQTTVIHLQAAKVSCLSAEAERKLFCLPSRLACWEKPSPAIIPQPCSVAALISLPKL